MRIWVEKVKTGEVWELDHDSTKEVYLDGTMTQYKCGLSSVHNYKFYPCDPREHCKEIERDSLGYHFNIKDYIKE